MLDKYKVSKSVKSFSERFTALCGIQNQPLTSTEQLYQN